MENRNLRLGIIVISLCLVLVVLVLVFQSTAKSSLPVDPTSQNITAASVTYNFYSPIKSITPGNNNTYTMVLSTPNGSIPQATVTSKTVIYNVAKVNNKLRFIVSPATILKAGQKVAVIMAYNLKTKVWTTQQVYLQSY